MASIRVLAVCAFALALLPSPGRALPDLSPEIYDVSVDTAATVDPGDVAEGCAAATDNRTLIRFGVRSHNVGDQALTMGDPMCPDCLTHPNEVCGNPLFICSPAAGHNHPHFSDFARYEVFDVAGNFITAGGKRSFCMLDTACTDGSQPVYTQCTDQGISPSCYDEYRPSLGCQYVDVTDVPGIGTRAFRLRVTIDVDQLLPDADRTNNMTEVTVFGCGDGMLQAGEECDPGPAGAPCCDASCHFVAAGVACAPSSNSCRGPGLCDGESAECGTGVPVADGTSCGANMPPCVSQVCRAGSCVTERGGGCVIDDACYPAATRNPANSCEVCDPARSTHVWSPTLEATPLGFRCQLARVAAAMRVLSCPARLTQGISTRVGRMDGLAVRLVTAQPKQAGRLEAKLGRRAAALRRLLAKAARRGTCATDVLAGEVQKLQDELSALRSSSPAR